MRWVSLGLILAATLAGAAALLFAAARAAYLVGAVAVLCAAAGGVLWFIAVIRTAAENAANKENIEALRRREQDRDHFPDS